MEHTELYPNFVFTSFFYTGAYLRNHLTTILYDESPCFTIFIFTFAYNSL
jgi:hypothetical protein